MAISSSGNSPNILEASKAAREKAMLVIGLCGFDGGKLRAISDITLYADADNYGVIEDVHQSIMHVLAQFLAISRERRVE